MTFNAKFNLRTFADAISRAQTIVDRKSTSNVLAHIMLSASNGAARLMATDYDVTFIADIEAEVSDTGSLALNGKALSDITRNLDADLSLKGLSNDWAELDSGRSSFKVAGVRPADFPEIAIPDRSKGDWVNFPKAALKDLLAKTAFAICEDETRMNLNGVFIRVQASRKNGTANVECASTDGHRLCHVTAEIDANGFSGERSAIVHKKGVNDLRKLIDCAESVVEVGFYDKGIVIFKAGKYTLIVRQIEDAFPDFRRVIPNGATCTFGIGRIDLVKAIRKVSVLTSNKSYIVKCQVDDKLTLSASNPDYGEAKDEVAIDVKKSGNVVFGVNWHYFNDILSSVSAPTVEVTLIDEFSPIKVTVPDEPGATFIVMPMRT